MNNSDDVSFIILFVAPSGKYLVRDQRDKESHCQIEIDIFVDDLIVHPPSGPWQAIAPLRILSFGKILFVVKDFKYYFFLIVVYSFFFSDIECVTASGRGFPTPTSDRVIQIASVLISHGSSDPIFNVVFTLNTCSSIPGATVCSFDTESEMLLKWRDLVVQTDPDIITGYNCINFDLNYLIVRATTLKLESFKQLCKLINEAQDIR